MRKTKLYIYPKWNPFRLFQVNLLRDCWLAPSKIMKSIANNSGKAERHVDGKILSVLKQNVEIIPATSTSNFNLLISINHINSNITKNTRKKKYVPKVRHPDVLFFSLIFYQASKSWSDSSKGPNSFEFSFGAGGCSWFQVNGDCTVIYLVIQWVQVDNDRDNRGS